MILSFTNATVQDITQSFASHSNVSCYTLHSYALKINHLPDVYILDSIQEARILEKIASDIGIDFGFICQQLKCITFNSMVLECLRFLLANPEYGREKIGDLDLLIIDEYQDFNPTERELLSAISKYSGDVIVLGDDDQSIYGFKDADPEGLIELYNIKDVEHIAHDNKCYRCPDSIVDAAGKMIKKNTHRINKEWHKTGKPGRCSASQFSSQYDANQFILSEIQNIKAASPDASFLILSPIGYGVDDLVVELESRSIEFVNFWQQALDLEVYYRIWWLRAIFSQRKVLNLLFLSKQLSSHYQRKLKSILAKFFRENFDEQQALVVIKDMYKPELSKHLADEPILEEFLHTHQEFEQYVSHIDETNIMSNLDSLIRAINPPITFLKEGVNIMSIHKSKGLQADYVFIYGLVNGVLPNNVKGLDTLEAQRRLMFVGATRALCGLYLISTVEWDKYVHRVDKSQFKYDRSKRIWKGRTSQFVEEMF